MIKQGSSGTNLVDRYWEKFFKANPNQQKIYGDEALNWFRRRISKDLNVKASQIIKSDDFRKQTSNSMIVGKLMLFEYAAESPGDSETGLYDRYPMCFIYDIQEINGNFVFYGLNVHYLTPRYRGELFKAMMKIKNTKTLNSRTRIHAEWSLIKQVAGNRIASEAVHAYRIDRMKSKFVEIQPQDWIVAVFLQIQRWAKPVEHSEQTQSKQRRAIRNRFK